MEVQFRPYSLALQITDADEDAVSLVDSGGNAIKCNFVSVEASGANANAYFRVITNPGDRTNAAGSDNVMVSGFASGLITPVADSATAAASMGVTASAAC